MPIFSAVLFYCLKPVFRQPLAKVMIAIENKKLGGWVWNLI